MAPGRSVLAFLTTLVFASLGLWTGACAQAPQPSDAPKASETKTDAAPDSPKTERVPGPRGEPPGRRGERGERERADHPDNDGKGPEGRRGGRDGRGPQGPPIPQTPQELEALRDQVMQELEKLTAEDRSEVWRTVWSSLNLPQDQKKSILGMDDDRRQKARQEVDQILQANDIQLPNDQRRRFFHRFFSERRAIEETLKKAGEARRVTLMQEFNAKLKSDFGASAAAQAATPSTLDAPKVDGPKPEPGPKLEFPFRPTRGDRPNGDNKGPGDGKNFDGKNPEAKGPDGKPKPEWTGRGPGRGPGGPGGFGPGPNFQGPPAPPTPQELEAMRNRAMKEIEKLTQEQRTEIWRTVAAVLKLTPEQRKSILTMESERRQKSRDDARKEMDEAIANNGLQFATNEQRGKFFFSYFNGRRKVEETLKKDDETRRAELMKELGGKLKTEFATPIAPVPEQK